MSQKNYSWKGSLWLPKRMAVIPPTLSRLSANYSPSFDNQTDKPTFTGVPVEMEEPKSLQQGCATSLVAALDPSIEGMRSSLHSSFPISILFFLILTFHCFLLSQPQPHPQSHPSLFYFFLFSPLAYSLIESSGSFLRDCRLMTSPVKPWAQGKENADRLWKLSEELVGGKFQSSVLN